MRKDISAVGQEFSQLRNSLVTRPMLKKLNGKNAVMPIIIRGKGKSYSWKIGEAKLSDVANIEKKMPRSYISKDGFHITEKAKRYFAPLIKGEDYPPYKNGLPQYARLKNILAKKKLESWVET